MPTAGVIVRGDFQAKTFVDQVVDVILEQALKGNILPGDRLYEQDLSKEFGVSRAPIREALRILEAQGAIESVPYRGMRLVELTAESVRQINQVRCELEKLALCEALDHNRAVLVERLQAIVKSMQIAVQHSRWFELATLDADFHEELCAQSRNPFLVKLFASLRPQLLIIFGVSLFEKPSANLAKEHVDLVAAIAKGSRAEAVRALVDHIVRDNAEINYARIIADRRAANERAKAKEFGAASLVRPRRGRPPKVSGGTQE